MINTESIERNQGTEYFPRRRNKNNEQQIESIRRRLANYKMRTR